MEPIIVVGTIAIITETVLNIELVLLAKPIAGKLSKNEKSKKTPINKVVAEVAADIIKPNQIHFHNSGFNLLNEALTSSTNVTQNITINNISMMIKPSTPCARCLHCWLWCCCLIPQHY